MLPRSYKVLPSIWHYNCVLRRLFYRSFQDDANLVRWVNLMSMGPLSYFICCQVNSLIRSSAMWNTLTEDKAFCRSTGGSFGRETDIRFLYSLSRVSVHSSRSKVLLFLQWKLSNVADQLGDPVLF